VTGRFDSVPIIGEPARSDVLSGFAQSFDNDDPRGSPGTQSWSNVPWRTIIATVAIVTATYVLITVLLLAVRIVTWVAISGFLAIVLAPLVRRVQPHVGNRRALATALVLGGAFLVLLGLLALFVLPVRTQLINIITDLPGTVHDAAQGRGPVGKIVQSVHLESYVRENEEPLSRAATRLTNSSIETAQQLFGIVFGFITVTLLTFLFLSQSAAIGNAALGLMPQRRRAAARRIGTGAAGAVSGYVVGNLLISGIAGTAAFGCLVALGVPSPVVLALWVAFADLIPLVGATIGAAVCVVAAVIHSPSAGVMALVFFIVYQQVENSIVYQWIMSRRVNVNPIGILLSVLLAVELFGIIGALLAVPVSGALQTVVSAVRREHRREQLVLPDHLDETILGDAESSG
jgi:predicted PurR-regulated permease PerM